MQVDERTLQRYRTEAPELLAAVDMESDGIPVMRRDPTTRHCVKMEDGLCSIHKKFGSIMLGDACHFYPRATRQLGGRTLMVATPSCPQVVRLMLALDAPFAPVENEVDRLPQQMRDYLPQGMDSEVAARVHQAFLDAALDESISPEKALARIANVARSIPMLDARTLDQAVSLYLKLADGKLPKAEPQPADPFNLLHALSGLIVASHKPISPRLAKTIADMEAALGAKLDWQNVTIALSDKSASLSQEVRESFDSEYYAHVLRRYLAMQISLHLFPFGGLGSDAAEKITIISVRFATIRLALACAQMVQGGLEDEEVVRIIQSLSRFLDHLGDGAYSLTIYRETGWTSEARALALFS